MTDQLPTLTPSDVADSLTGWDEIAIEKAFGIAPEKLTGSRAARALVFVLLRRDGAKDAEARQRALDMPASEAKTYFADETPELDPENPETEAGKADSLGD